ncbi:MAG: hypothetical protein QXD69_06210 [Candidatus Bathyarchaeia archaeon]
MAFYFISKPPEEEAEEKRKEAKRIPIRIVSFSQNAKKSLFIQSLK